MSETQKKPDTTEKTEVLKADLETLNKEIQKAKEQAACLIMIRGNLQGHRFFLTTDMMTIGRDPGCDITIPDPSISRQHARVVRVGTQIQVVDLKSANGTLLNGKKIEPDKPMTLAKEDMVRLGNTILKYVPAGEYEILFYSDMDNKAYTDPLTHINNKRYLLEALEAEFKRAKALSNDLSLCVLDLDHFKKVNDTYGHDAGDFVLREFAAIVKGKYIRPKDVFARFGGEEFVILLTNTAVTQAQETAETIRAAVEAHAFIYDGKRIPVTVSIGATELTASIETSAALMKIADKAVYESKNNGRNRVTALR